MMQHLACIMDGNRRWARAHGLALLGGGREGLQRIDMVVQFCLSRGVAHLSLYAFSLENFRRAPHECAIYFGLILDHGKEHAAAMRERNVRVRFVGDRTLFPEYVHPMIEHIEQETAGGTALTVHFLFCYGGQQEIIAALPALCEDVKRGVVDLATFGTRDLKRYLWLGDVPDPDLVIRTGFVHRLSGFLTYQTTYSELYFVDCLWPDITEKNLADAFAFFEGSKRNFGK